ncbi:hypothetical protein J5J10_13605 [Ciceribacter sp. L1K23]|uniref:hypothetical protein n=1 Tax=unclassified Ciceribacter TaxID=2628820 RepID=UPI001ABDD0D1|nr:MULTISPECIES: hypothetical protein [unclassified Ciceribacter]MBO3759136.1 hypothetical protein [Ciceribacter sp. L1K22]MBR0556717.1 hypothetical protein [Ciceribacter sp. L1K23]
MIKPSGLSPVTMGMTVEAAKAALSDFLIPDEIDEACFLAATSAPEMDMMFEDGTLTRIYVIDPSIRTEKGVHVGSSEEEVRAAYGEALKIEVGFYDETTNVMTYLDGENGLVFETDGMSVITISAGTRAALQYVEGCS